jgi:hypothetical protein
MDVTVARERLSVGMDELKKTLDVKQKRERYFRGDHDRPFAPQGVNEEYIDLQDQAIANWIALAVGSPVQRLRGDSFVTHVNDDLDKRLWRNVWQANRMDSMQALPYRDMMMHGRGIVSVWPNTANKSRPIVRPESNELVYVHPSEDDPFTAAWAVKVFTVRDYSPEAGTLVLPTGTPGTVRTVGIVYDDTSMIRFEKGGKSNNADFEAVADGTHPMGENPFVTFDYRPDAMGRTWSPMDPLIPQQDAINTIRFNTLLAMQFSAFRQRIVVGFDPVVRDEQGNVVFVKNADGSLKLDGNGNPTPQVTSAGKIGVDRLLAFPGGDTKVFDLPESNLGNYITVLGEFLTQFFATGQIPPQYLLSRMANLSGDALTGAESTLASLVKEIQLIGAESNEGIFRRGAKCAGEVSDFPDAEMNYADAEAKSFAQVVDGIQKLIAVDFPHRDAFALLPGATKQKVDDWMDHMEDESFTSTLANAARAFQVAPGQSPVNDQTEITNGAPAIGSGSLPPTAGN